MLLNECETTLLSRNDLAHNESSCSSMVREPDRCTEGGIKGLNPIGNFETFLYMLLYIYNMLNATY